MQPHCHCGLPTTDFVVRRHRRRCTPCPLICPCTNLVINGGFNVGTAGQPIDLPWVISSPAVVYEDTEVFVADGEFINGTPSALSARIPPGEYLFQRVPIVGGRCYALNFAQEDGPIVGTLTFLTEDLPCPTPTNPPPPGTPNRFTPNLAFPFPLLTVEACAPPEARFACIGFINFGNVTGYLDTVSLRAIGGPCPC